jgi:hypothetical protein
MRRTNRRTPAVLVTVTVLLAGCAASSSDNPPAAKSSTTSTAAPESVVSWADSVCVASTGLTQAVGDVHDAAAADLSSTTPEAVRTELVGHVDALQQAATSLGTAVESRPRDADPAVVATKDDLEAAAVQARTAVTKLAQSVLLLRDASSAADIQAQIPTVQSSASQAASALDVLGTALRQTLTSADASVQQAFAAAPACRAATATPSP